MINTSIEPGDYVTFLNENELSEVIEELKEKHTNRIFSKEYTSCIKNLAGQSFCVIKKQGPGYVLDGDNENLYYSKILNQHWIFYRELFTDSIIEENTDILPLFG